MAKFKAGDRVKIVAVERAGEAGTVVRKGDEKGERIVRFDDGSERPIHKSSLALADGWVPKVGDRVRVVRHCNWEGRHLPMHAPLGSEHLITELRDYFADKGVPTFVLSDGGNNFYTPLNVEPLPVAEQPAPSQEVAATAEAADAGGGFKAGDRIRLIDCALPSMPLNSEFEAVARTSGNRASVHFKGEDGYTTWRPGSYFELVAPLTIQSGSYYRTRDGRKVGPITKPGYYEEWPFEFEGKTYRPDGTQAYEAGNTSEADLVAEWVEPAAEVEASAEVAVAEATATEQPKFKAGDKVRVIDECGGTTFRIGEIYTVAKDAFEGDLLSVEGTKRSMFTRRFELVTPEPATAEAKFKVGDRVRIIGDADDATVKTRNSKGRMSIQFDWAAQPGIEWWGDDELELIEPAPTPSTPATTPTTNFIVARLTPSGQPRPNARPRVHATLADAEQEAARLADRLGDEFAVYQRVAVREVDAGPVPPKWEQAFDAALAKGWVRYGRGEHPKANEAGLAFAWASTKQGFRFWSEQNDTLTPLGRAILRKWIAEVEAGQGDSQKEEA